MTPARLRGRRAAVTGAALLVLLVILIVVTTSGSPGPSRDAAGHRPRSPSTTQPAAPVLTALGASGVTSSAVAAENNRPGTSAWQITAPGPGTIEGFASTTYAAVGDTVGVYVSTDAPSFTVDAYRMGFYGGLGARLVWSSGAVAGSVQPDCPVDSRTNMVSCTNWSRSLSVRITSAFVPGDYLLKLTGSAEQQSYVLLTVWDPTSTATYLVLNRSLVEQGWNTFGGYSYYSGKGPCILDKMSYPPCNRARVVSFDRPFTGNGSSDFLDNEYPLVEFMEQQHLDVTYCTDICLSEHPAFIAQHRALVDTDHDETWTDSERTGVIDAVHAGVNVAFLGAATLVRHARLEPSSLGPDREEVDYRNGAEDPLDGHASPFDVTGNTWSAPPTNWNATSLVGEFYSGYIRPGRPSAPMVVYDASAWIFKGMGLTAGQAIPNVINSDFDHVDAAGPPPASLQVFAHSPISLTEAFSGQGSWAGSTYSDMTYYTDGPGQAGVFDSGDNTWVADMRPCPGGPVQCPSAMVESMTANLLWLFGQGPAGRHQPSVANWRTVTPAGS